MGHAGKEAIKQLHQLVTGMILKGPITVEYKLCGVSKAHKVVFRRYLTWSMVPFYKIHFNLIPGIVVYNGDKYIVHFFNKATRINKVEIIVKKLSLT